MEIGLISTGNQVMKKRTITSLRSILSDVTDPVFIVENETDLITATNEVVLAACGSFNPSGEKLENIVHFETSGIKKNLAFFNNRWLVPEPAEFYWNNKLYTKVVLKQPSSIPDSQTLFMIRNMIAVLVHRLRSPMTGMQGYLEKVEEVKNEDDQRKLAKVGEGLDYLFEIMDELELLHHAEAFVDDSPAATTSSVVHLVNDLLLSYPASFRNRVTIHDHSDSKFAFNPAELSRILSLLLNNAAEHPSAKDDPVIVTIRSNRQISITNAGNPIPEDVVDSLYFPFVTTKANNMGIGLSLAQLMAERRNAAIMLTENSLEKGITFSLLCSPVDH